MGLATELASALDRIEELQTQLKAAEKVVQASRDVLYSNKGTLSMSELTDAVHMYDQWAAEIDIQMCLAESHREKKPTL